MNIKNIRQNNGITMVALVITIILLLILSGISITGVIRGVDETQEASQFSQLNMIQHTLLERKTKAQFTKEELPGTEISEENLEKVLNEIKEKTNQEIILKGEIQDYKELNTSDLENLGISKDNDTYIVNYKTGEVINKTKLTTKSGKILYTYSE